ncbi:UV DNA damage repair endonuclease UvsE [Candidatus Formimonas warabiya]|uniref:UV damage endonuclease UvsE n=1 Tax=Formimonas warabiya TaxID=1761012 RepID=A0A3G1KRP3_FORW1|nr:UV DNA damage repair endonuclease UvsE [Candidatus Formimonas warabiya]ATW25131.1 UV damage endonuclease UvsE [Candidatus Formimonas warabiya]
MKIRLGYAALSLQLENCSPAKTVTFKTYSGIADQEARLDKLRRVARQNIENTFRVLRYNTAHDILLYRFSSQIIPLATHPLVEDWDYLREFAPELQGLGHYCRAHHLRVSAHPDHFTVINSPDEAVVAGSIKDLDYHAGLFRAMGLDKQTKMVLHIGGRYQDKTASLKRFLANFQMLPSHIKSRLMLENDDRSYSAGDVIEVCRKLKVPMVLDVHHHLVHHAGEQLSRLLPQVYATWTHQIPKLHFSSPRSPEKIRCHAQEIDPESFYHFIMTAREFNQDIDVMLEAKNKDLALFALVKEMSRKKGVTLINEAMMRI